MTKKRLYIIIGSAVAVVIIGIVLYTWLRPKEVVTEQGAITPLVGSEDIRIRLTDEEIAQGKTEADKQKELQSQQDANRPGFEDVSEVTVRKVLDSDVLSPTLSKDRQKILYFDSVNNEFYQSNPDGSSVEAITSGGFNNVYNVKWGDSKDAAIVVFSGDAGTTKRFISFNFNNQAFNDLGNNVADAAVSPDGSKIVYLFVDQNNDVSNISSADFDGSKWKIVRPYHMDNVSLAWPDPFKFVVAEEPTGYDMTSLFSLETSGDTMTTVVGDAYGLSYTLSPDGKKLLYTASSARPNEVFLYMTDIEGNEHKDLGLSTMAEKCAFAPDNKTVYCGVPQNKNVEFVLPDDYLQENYVTEDSFFRIDTDTGKKERLAGPTEFNLAYDVFDPFISESGRTMYFKRRQDDRLYGLIVPENK
ncbi:hypothetical protein KKH43_01940 [Patescibacteria group bacterium]|nr:hypothetical protein [Patescibacteria group bacterium]